MNIGWTFTWHTILSITLVVLLRFYNVWPQNRSEIYCWLLTEIRISDALSCVLGAFFSKKFRGLRPPSSRLRPQTPAAAPSAAHAPPRSCLPAERSAAHHQLFYIFLHPCPRTIMIYDLQFTQCNRKSTMNNVNNMILRVKLLS